MSLRPINLSDWQQAYRDGASPATLLGEVIEQLRAEADQAVVIRSCSPDELAARLAALELATRAHSDNNALLRALPLYGVPFAVKDNIDVAGVPTTAACPAFAYTPVASAEVVQRLEAAGAVWIAKTNLDQFATGEARERAGRV